MKLQLDQIPDGDLPCRDDEREQIRQYVTNGIKNSGSSSSLYISGMPGTGKTANTMQVISKIRKTIKFDFVLINAM